MVLLHPSQHLGGGGGIADIGEAVAGVLLQCDGESPGAD